MAILPKDIHRDLYGEIDGEINTGMAVRAAYSTAACIYRIMPLAVIRPQTAGDAAKVVRYAAGRGLPITARGGGSGVAGHSIGPGIIIDFSAFMDRITAEGDDWVEVEPGIVLDRLNARLAKRGMRFRPDPSSGSYCTIGGMIANNSSGPRGIQYGSTRNHIVSLQAIESGGNLIRTNESGPWIDDKLSELKKILESYRRDIDERRPKVTKNSSGYQVWDKEGPDIVQILTGSEGTLAIVTSARLKIYPLPPHKGVALLHFPSPASATASVPRLREEDPSAIEIMDAAFLDIVRSGRPDLKDLLPEKGRTLLLVEHEGGDEAEVDERLFKTEQAALDAGADRVESSLDPAQVNRLWQVRKAGSPIISSVRGPGRPLRFVEDVIVPPENLAEFADRFIDILRRNHCTAPIIGHAGDGNIHVNPIIDMREPGFKTVIRRVADSVYELVDRFNGSISAEHGDGRLRAPYLERHYGPNLYRAFREIKSLFDPKGIFNPGVMLGEGEITDNLRWTAPIGPGTLRTSTALDDREVWESIFRCHGCGDCRDDCPVFGAVKAEEFSPRGRLNMARAVLCGELPLEEALNDPQFRNSVAACLSCARCEAGCSSSVDVPMLVSRMKGLLPGTAVERMRDAVLSNPRRAFYRMSKLSLLANPLQRLPGVMGLASRLGHLNPDRRLPEIKGRSMKETSGKYLQTERPDVVYFPGCYAVFVDPEGVGTAVLRIIERLGLKPRVASFGCCGMPAAASGDLNGGMAMLGAAIDEINKTPSVPVITSCPSCAKMLRGELTGASVLAGRLESAQAFIAGRLASDIKLRPVQMSVAIQTPCHQRDDAEREAVLGLMRRIPGLEIKELPDVCCGMGGAAGFKSENRGISAAVGASLIEALEQSGAGAALSTCGACRAALAAVSRDMHPLTLLAMSMGII